MNHLNHLLEKTADWDKDERYMATNDICNELAKDIKIDETMERRICTAVLKQLDDQSNDVQSVAVKCLAILLKKVQRAQVGEICDKLSSLILDGQDALRDIYSIGLKTLIADVPDEMGPLVAERLTGRLLNGISRAGSEEIKRECLDNLSDLLRRFGNLLEHEHDQVMNVVVRQLECGKPVIRKRAAICLGSLAVVSSDALLNRLVELILEQIDAAKKTSGKGIGDIRTLIQTIGAISKSVGHRLGRHLDRLVPLFLEFLGDPEADIDDANDTANELREHCFPGLESFALRCPREVTAFLPEILKACLAFMKYDPNYSYDEDEDAEAMDEDDADDMYDEEDFAGSDDDDDSWKVRKNAVKVINAIIISHPMLLQQLYETCATELVGRFKEREENVRVDVINCTNSLLLVAPILKSKEVSTPKVEEHPVIACLEKLLQQLITVSQKTLNENSIKAKCAIFALFRTLLMVLPESAQLLSHLPALLKSAEKCLTDKNQTLKLDALIFLRLVLESKHAANLSAQETLSSLLPQVINTVNADWYKIIAEGLRVLGATITCLRPRDPSSDMFTGDAQYAGMVQPIYTALLPRLEALDIDQEIKESSIVTVGKLFAYLGDELTAELPKVLSLLRKRLDNETTRVATMRALGMIAASPLQLDLSGFVQESLASISHFLRQQSRLLKQTTLTSLSSLIASPSATAAITEKLASEVLSEISPLIVDSDLHLLYLALQTTLGLLESLPACAPAVCSLIYPRARLLASSPLLQGQAQKALVELFQKGVTANVDGMRFAEVLDALYVRGDSRSNDLQKQSVSNLAKCICGICMSTDSASRSQTVNRFAGDLQGSDNRSKQLALLSLGELGKQTDLGETASLKDLILACFESTSEDVKTAASFALGSIAVGNMAMYLPIVLQSVESNRHQYLLLAALKEVIVVHSVSGRDFEAYLQHVLPGLISKTSVEEEGIRAMVAECLGSLTCMHPAALLPLLKELASLDAGELSTETDALKLWTVATSVRFALSKQHDHNSSAASLLSSIVGQLLPLIQHPELEVRKATLQMANALTHHNSIMAAPYLQVMTPLLCETLGVKLERTVDLGPFKHKVDDGLPLRKAALTCIDTLLCACPERLNMGFFMDIFVPKLVPLLTDKDEIKLQAHQVVLRICALAPATLLTHVETLMEPLEKQLSKKMVAKDKDASGGQSQAPEAERAVDLLRSGVRVVVTISGIEGVSQNRRWQEFVERVSKRESTTELYRTVCQEKSAGEL